MRTPLIIIARDRVDMLLDCVESLTERCADLLDIHIVDHGSTWPAMLDLIEEWEDNGTLTVHRRPNRTPHSLWLWPEGLADIVGLDEPYLVTDPDVVLDDTCPSDWLTQLYVEAEGSHGFGAGAVKVGLGLRLDDLPDTPLAARVRQWEAPFWQDRVPSGRAWRAPVDTTLALYPPLGRRPDFALGPALRLAAPYLLRHLPWYAQGEPSEEIRYYREHALPGSTTW